VAETSFSGQLSGSPFDSDIAALGERDFVRRSEAAERLVAAGGASLEALGAAGDRPTPAPGSLAESTTAPVIVAILGRASDAEVQALTSSTHASLRAAAAQELGRRGAWTPVPALIELLADAQPAVREAAHAALRRITGEVAEPSGSTVAGAASSGGSRLERWRLWWRQEGSARAQEAAEPHGS
jgi:HEAT repeat protein